MGKESFVIYKSFYKPISKLSDKQLGRLFRAIFLYQLGEVVTVEEDIDMAFEFFKNQFEIDESKYQGIVERNRKNGRKEGSKDIEEHTKGGKKPVAPSGVYNDNDNVNDNDNERDNPPLPPGIIPLPLDECFKEIAADAAWLRHVHEKARMDGFKVSADDCMNALRQFYVKLQSEGETHKHVHDAKSHFSRWYAITLKAERDSRLRQQSSSGSKSLRDRMEIGMIHQNDVDKYDETGSKWDR